MRPTARGPSIRRSTAARSGRDVRFTNPLTGAVVELDYAPAGEDWTATRARLLDDLAVHPETCGPCPECAEALDEPGPELSRRDIAAADRAAFWRTFKTIRGDA